MFSSSSVSLLSDEEELTSLRKNLFITPRMKRLIQTLELELNLLRLSILCLPEELALDNYDCTAEFKDTQTMLTLYSTAVVALFTKEFKQDWNFRVSELEEHIEHSIRRCCVDLFGSPAGCAFPTMSELIAFLDLMHRNLKGLTFLKPDKITVVKEQIEVLEQKIEVFRDFADFVGHRCTCPGDLQKFLLYIQDWQCKATHLLLLYWIHGAEEQMALGLNHILSDLLKVMNPCTPQVTGMYLRLLTASKSSDSDNLLMGEIVSNIVDLLLEPVVIPMTDCMLTLRDGLIILTTFLMNPPKSAEKPQILVQIQRQVDAILDEAVFIISLLSLRATNDDTDKECTVLGELMKKIDNIITLIYSTIVDSSMLNFPTTNVLGFIDFLLERLAKWKESLRHNANLIPFAKHQIVSIHEELMSARPFLKDFIVDIQDDQKDLWMKIVDVAYQADYLIDSCQIMGFPVWHTMISLSHVRKQIKLIESEAQIIQDNHRQKTGVFSVKVCPSQAQHAQARISSHSDVVVGFEDEAGIVIDKLKGGSKHLNVISIVGMAGIGKTTLAQKVYNDTRVQSYFHKCAWCTVSQSFAHKQLLLAILNNLSIDGISDMEEEDLADKLRRSLMGRRYLIVMDDIWDSAAWEKLKHSFPDQVNGSRIMYTSRIQKELATEHDNYAHSIRLLSNEESLMLLQGKLELKGGISSEFLQIAEEIVKSCKRLPLSIVVVAGLLRRESWNLNWWKHIAETLVSKLASEGECKDILQLSYNHLPDILRPCFLYFAAFREDQVIEVKKLTQFWIAEGFIQKIGTRSLEDVAMEYLLDLIDRSLVIVSRRGPTGEIRACQIHDLLHNLCREKSGDEKFLCSVNLDDSSLSCIKYDQHRLCIHSDSRMSSPHLNFPSGSAVRTLLISGDCLVTPSFLNSFKFLRVLNFESFHRFHYDWDGLDPTILSLTHLRYLGVSHIRSSVPSSIANLENLEIIRVLYTDSRIFFPTSIWMMKNLRHVDLGTGAAVIGLGDEDLMEDSQLEHLDSFSSLSLGDSDDTEKMLRRLPRIRKLSVIIESSKHNCHDQGCIHFPRMDFLSKLESLKLCFHLRVFHTCHFSFPSTLKELILSNFCRPWSAMSVIGKLPHLEVLKLLPDAFVGEYWEVEEDQFLKLKYLKLQHLDIVEWNASIESFPCLEALVVDHCAKLEEIPSSFGELSTLKLIKLYGCFKAESSVRQIVEEQQDGGNEGLQVLIKDNKYKWNGMASGDDELVEASQLDHSDGLSMLALNDNDAERKLSRLPTIRKLSLKNFSREDCFEGCIQFPVMDFLTKIESLELCFESRVFHTCRFSFPSTLKELILSNFCRSWSTMSVIGKLPNLEILKLLSDAFVGNYWEVQEDEHFLKLKYLKLQNLDIREWNASIESFPCLEALLIDNCSKLEQIPSTFGELSSTLKIIKLCDCSKAESSVQQIIKEKHELGNEGLQVLVRDKMNGIAVVALDYEEPMEKYSQKSRRLLDLSCLDFDDTDEVEMMLRKVRKLSVIIESSEGHCCGEGCIQFSWMDFHGKLESLSLWCTFRVTHTCHFSFPSTLRKLTLTAFCHPWSAITVIGMLPHLEVLKLHRNAFKGECWEVEDEQFLKLKYLGLYSLDFVKWNASTQSFPHLEELFVEFCAKLEVIPSTFGELSTLKIIRLSYCFKAESSVRQIVEEQQQVGNEGIQLFIDGIILERRNSN